MVPIQVLYHDVEVVFVFLQGFRRLATKRIFDDAAVSAEVPFSVPQGWHALLVIVDSQLQLVAVSVV